MTAGCLTPPARAELCQTEIWRKYGACKYLWLLAQPLQATHISCSQKKVEDFPGCDVMPASPDDNWIESCEGDPGSRGVAKNEQNNKITWWAHHLDCKTQNTISPLAWHHNNLAWKPQITPGPSQDWHLAHSGAESSQRIPGSLASDWLLSPDPGFWLAELVSGWSQPRPGVNDWSKRKPGTFRQETTR